MQIISWTEFVHAMGTTGPGRIHMDEKSNFYATIPAKIVRDSRFKFKNGESTTVELVDGKLVITPESTTSGE